ncbi:EAL domain-containing protein [Marinobacter orientalis]|uniref:cyclic-guanylate-specific phosphodiesterase n=1 Tax=Marinobacter orientalis TaxID=1928859 RepID=A0A7Y0RB14_9GAMM|nr:EAL domain-containing protein [Marinobacter orientalis]NMT62942.1 EAL domain-containing protein [Marinobacter orientalis]TGX51609.1 EAL domain-containing protein [Marinobacter orientalis]
MTENDPLLRILLIEDDEDDYLITLDLLQDSSPVSTRLDWVDSYREGIAALETGDYAVALVDLRLGPDSGIELIQQARERNITTPFILLTGQGDDELDVRAVELGAADYLVKGTVDGHTLIRSIRYAIDRAMATESLATSESHYRLLFENNPAPMCLMEPDSQALVSMNEAARVLYGYSNEEITGLTLNRLRAADHTLPRLSSEGILLREGGILKRHQRRDGREMVVEVVSTSMTINHRPLKVLMITDVTSQLDNSRQLRLFKRSIESSSNGIIITDARQDDLPIIYVNRAFEKITGYSADEAFGKNCRFLQGSDFDLSNEQGLGEIRRGLKKGADVSAVLRNYRKDGAPFWNDLYISPMFDDDGEITHFIGVQNDISERKSAEHELAFNISHDVLTGLPNRSLLEDRLSQACQLSRRYGRTIALLFVDLDGFKLINDSLGHRLGDQLLIEVGRRLNALVRSGDTVARISGDEFIILLPDLAQAEDAVIVVESAIHEIASPYHLDGETVHLTASAGISTTDGSIEKPMALLQQADLAMYRAKQQGRNTYQWFSQEFNEEASFRVALRNELQDAIDQEQLSVYYQPLVDARSGQTRNVEALVRWQHPVRGLISPGDFVPLAEETGQIIALGEWVLRKACRDMVHLHSRGFRHCSISVNVSPIQLRKEGFIQTVTNALRASGLPPESLELEVVESAILLDTDLVINTLHTIRELGVHIAIDDFGTGFSSLSYIKLLPANKIKIDRSFIRDVIENRSDAAITQGVISMAHHLGLEVVAEGVETEAHAAYLRKNHCDLLQGFAFARPMPFDDLLMFLNNQVSGNRLAPRTDANSDQDRTLLLLDDEENILRALTRVLRRDGYRILTTTSVKEAFSLLAAHQVQVIVSDQRMPEMSGTDFLSEVKAIHPETVRIVLSGYTDLKSVTDAINEGAIYRFLTKPWDDQQIREHIQQAFLYYRATVS